MENPRTWCETRKLIMASLSGAETIQVSNVLEALIDSNKVRSEDRDEAFRILEDAKKKFDKQMELGMCGYSVISQMYYALKWAKLLVGDGDGEP